METSSWQASLKNLVPTATLQAAAYLNPFLSPNVAENGNGLININVLVDDALLSFSTSPTGPVEQLCVSTNHPLVSNEELSAQLKAVVGQANVELDVAVCIRQTLDWMSLQLSMTTMTAVGLPEDVLNTIITYSGDGHSIMRLGLCSRSWRRVVLRSTNWEYLWNSSGYSFAGFRSQYVQGLSFFQKYCIAAHAGSQMRNLRAAITSLVEDEDSPKHANIFLGSAVNHGTSRYVVYTVIERVVYSSYDADHALLSKSVDLSSYPNLKHDKLSRAETYARMLGRDRMCQPWNVSWYSITENIEGNLSTYSMNGHPDPSRRFNISNSHADFPFVLFFQQMPQASDATVPALLPGSPAFNASMRSVIYDTDKKQWSWLPFALPDSRYGAPHRFSGPWLVASLEKELRLYRINFDDGSQSSYIGTIKISSIQDHLKVPVKSFEFDVAHNGRISVAVVTSSHPTACITFTGDLRGWSEERFLQSGLSYEVGVSQIDRVTVDTRYTTIRTNKFVTVLDHVSRKFQLVLRVNEPRNFEVTPIDSTCFLLSTKTKVQLLDFGLRGISGMPQPAPLASAVPNYAIADLSSTKSIKMVSFNPKRAAEQLAAVMANTKMAIDGVVDPNHQWTVTYVLHNNFKIKKSEHSKTHDQFVSMLEKLEATQVNSDFCGFRLEDATDLIKESAGFGTPSKGFISHSRSGQHQVSAKVEPIVSKTSAVVIRISTFRTGQRSSYIACSITDEEVKHTLKTLGFQT